MLRHLNKNFYIEQWETVNRWYFACNDFKGLGIDGPNILDIYSSFYINAYHLKDWLTQWLKVNDQEQLVKKIIDDFNTIQCLKFLKDVCQGLKHFQLTGEHTKKSSNFSINIDPEKRQYIIHLGRHHVPVDILATDVYIYWHSFFKDNGLLELKNKPDFSGPLSLPPLKGEK